MSAGYASRLSEYPNKGVVGLPERYESKRALTVKLRRLVDCVKSSHHLVVLTGAGISTTAGIPDFRGPKGIWTLEKEEAKKKRRKNASSDKFPKKGKEKKRKRVDDDVTGKDLEATKTDKEEEEQPKVLMDFSKAQPTLTHRAITKLSQVGKLKYCVTQNVDGLHRRAGLPRSLHCSLHGCAFTEKCSTCSAEYFRDKDVGGMSFKPTGNICTICGGELHDTLLDWEDPLPEDDLERSEEEFGKADLVLCLGTSLRIEPAGSLPQRGRKFVIVNLQETAKDGYAHLIVRAKVDEVMDHLMTELGYKEWKEEPPPEIERVFASKKSSSKKVPVHS